MINQCYVIAFVGAVRKQQWLWHCENPLNVEFGGKDNQISDL